MSKLHKGKKLSAEHKLKVSNTLKQDTHTGKNHSNYGKTLSKKTKAKLSAVMTGVKRKPHSAERKAMQRKAIKDWWAKRKALKLAA